MQDLLRLKSLGLTHQSLTGRSAKKLTLSDGSVVTEFLNCSYLGLDQHQKVVEAYSSVPQKFGANFCAARTRMSYAPQIELEQNLSRVYGRPVVTFPSTSTAHISVMPLLIMPEFFTSDDLEAIFVFDKYSHSSMQFLKPILNTESQVYTILHGDYDGLKKILEANLEARVIYVADTVYSMGGVLDFDSINLLCETYENLHLYLDDAHGTTVFGENGTGFIWDRLSEKVRDRTVLALCLSKGFGTNGGALVLPGQKSEFILRSFGQIYAFSGTLENSSVMASLASLEIQKTNELIHLRTRLWENAAVFDAEIGANLNSLSPIRMIKVGSSEDTIECGKKLLDIGFLTSVAVFPIVPKNNPQIRLCISALHTQNELVKLARFLKNAAVRYNVAS